MNDEIYRKQQFGQKIGFGRLPALLVVDFVNGFTDPDILGGGNILDAVEATKPLLPSSARRSCRLSSPASSMPMMARMPACGARRCRGCAT